MARRIVFNILKKELYFILVCTIFYFGLCFVGCNNNLIVALQEEVKNNEKNPPAPGDDGRLTFGNVTSTSLTVSWLKAEDDFTNQDDLEYQLVHSDMDNITSVADAEKYGTVAKSWTKNIDSVDLTDLTEDTTHYFNVLVKDNADNKAAYTSISVQTILDEIDPTAGNSGQLATSNLTPYSLTLTWTKGSDDITPENMLKYRVVRSYSDNLNTHTDAYNNGLKCHIADWITDIDQLSITGLTNDTTYYINVILEDLSGNRAIYYRVQITTVDDSTAPTPGNSGTISVTGIGTTSLTLNWTVASDTYTTQADLQYKVVQSLDDNINSVIDVEVSGNGTVIQDWTDNIYTLPVSGLIDNTLYYFNVLVKDLEDNMNIYNRATATTVKIQRMYWTDKTFDMIYRSELDGSNQDTILTLDSSTETFGVAVDSSNKKVYYTEQVSGAYYIKRVNLDGSESENVVSSGITYTPFGIAIGTISSNLYVYWVETNESDSSMVKRRNLTTMAAVETLLNLSSCICYDLDLDLTNSKLYFTEMWNNRIVQADLDGSNDTDHVTGLQTPCVLKIDPINGYIYWIDTNSGFRNICRAFLSTGTIDSGFNIAVNLAYGIDLDTSGSPITIYWTEDDDDIYQYTTSADHILDSPGSPREIVLDL